MKAKSVRVMNLGTGQQIVYGDIAPDDAVRFAYLQYTMRNWNTWDYDKAETPPLTHAKQCVTCGDFCAFTTQQNDWTEY